MPSDLADSAELVADLNGICERLVRLNAHLQAAHARDAERIAHLESVLNRIADAVPQTIRGCRHDDGERDCATCDKLITWAAEAVG